MKTTKTVSRLLSLVIALMATLTMGAAECEVNGISYVQLNNGVWMPRLGLGTFRIPDNATCKDAVLTALRMGYRHINTAHAYMDEPGVGDAVNEFVKESGVKREEIWVTSKLWPTEYADPAAIDNMLRRMHLDYVDLVYLHQPVDDVRSGWRNLEKAVKEGKILHWGISEVTEEYLRRAHKVCPVAAIQNRYSMMARWHERLFPVCEELGVGFVAFSPLANRLLSSSYDVDSAFDAQYDYRAVMPQYQKESYARNRHLFALLDQLTEKHHATPAQVSMAWTMSKKPWIADMFGFSSPAYFCRYVQHNLGMSPTMYRD